MARPPASPDEARTGRGAHARFRLRIGEGDEIAIGPGKIALLEQVLASGSINAAAKAMGMSYRRAWMLIDEVNRHMAQPVVLKATGGAHGGGTEVTAHGRKLIALYRKVETDAAKACARDLRQIIQMLARP